jgi:uncharacterized C2H2 Zn-finger protein
MTAQGSRLTAADVAAAVRLGTLDPTTALETPGDRPDSRDNTAAAPLPADHHDCGIPGCRHGEAHTGVSQPDRQVKLACPRCGAVARMTARALRVAGAIVCQRDGEPFAVAPRRAYNRK